ncbi:MAG: 2-hydroxyacyl-CoA dehydratase family protein, partial [Dehalococcoidia bacterium]|jgi:benzoyl-CoA reductase/2-hydroxyglutaryl-CoA dehydratase subunit BcrC/BadD/HgdB
MSRFFDPFCRSQIGYWALGEDPLYQMIDLFVIPIADRNIMGIADCWEMWTDTKLFKLAIPHNKSERSFQYYLDRLQLLKAELEKLTGQSITEDKLKKEIDTANRIKRLLRQISELRKSDHPPISGRDYIKLHHASFLADRNFLAENLESLYQELKGRERPIGPRIFLIASTLAQGDYKVYDLLQPTGADIVIEEFSEGMRPYWQAVESDGDLMRALATSYLLKRTPLPFSRPSVKERNDLILGLVREFKVDGIIWYSLMYRDSYNIDSIYFGRKAVEEGIPFLSIMSDYDNAETGQLRTRIEAFIESIGGN